MKKTTRAFTLIELLVVIAIIALLVALLLPSLRRAMDLVHRVTCTSNSRLIATACLTYAEDNDGYGPLENSDEYPIFPNYLHPYWGGEAHPRTFRDPWRGPGGCPTWRSGYWSAMADYLSIAINGRLCNAGVPNVDCWHKLTGINVPGEVIMSHDSAFPLTSFPPFPRKLVGLLRDRYRGSTVLIYGRHRGEGLNFGFVDGHAEFSVYSPPRPGYPYGSFSGGKKGFRPN